MAPYTLTKGTRVLVTDRFGGPDWIGAIVRQCPERVDGPGAVRLYDVTPDGGGPYVVTPQSHMKVLVDPIDAIYEKAERNPEYREAFNREIEGLGMPWLKARGGK